MAEQILAFYERSGLSIKDLRGQCYDGASNMSSAKNGVSGIISLSAPNAPYLHCSSRCLNLSIASACCKINIVEHVINVMRQVSIFFNYSPKREALLSYLVQRSGFENNSQRKVLVGLCKTRWAERHTAIEHFYLAIPFLVEAFEIMIGTHPDIAELDDMYPTGWDAGQC